MIPFFDIRVTIHDAPRSPAWDALWKRLLAPMSSLEGSAAPPTKERPSANVDKRGEGISGSGKHYEPSTRIVPDGPRRAQLLGSEAEP